MLGTEELSALIARIYEGALDASRWAGMLVAVNRAIGAKGAQLMIAERPTLQVSESAVVGFPEEGHERYRAYFPRIDPRAGAALERPMGEFVACHEVRGDGVAMDHELHRDLPAPCEGCYARFGRLHDDGTLAAIIGFHPDRSRVPLTARALDILSVLTPHLTRAMRIFIERSVLRDRASLGFEALNGMDRPVFIADERARIVFMNVAASRMIAGRDGLFVDNGVLRARASDESSRLHELIRSGTRPTGRRRERAAPVVRAVALALRISRPGHRSPLSVSVTPLSSHPELAASGLRTYAVVLVNDGAARPAMLAHDLRDRYGLSGAEARLAVALAEGRRLDEIGASLGVSRNTLKTQLKAVYSKTGVRRQADLVRLVAIHAPPISTR
jgi:DNA-binding CsgD family transcriptional regulator